MEKSKAIVIKNGTFLTADPDQKLFHGDLHIAKGKIAGLYPQGAATIVDAQIIRADDCLVTPGFIQTHVHLTQTLFRGLAEDLALIEWLRQKIFPFEQAHDEDSLKSSSLLALAELLLSGTTAILDMGGLKHTDVLFQAAQEMQIRYTGGKGMSDMGMAPYFENTDKCLADSVTAADRWHNANNSLLRYAFSPRFLLSCTPELIKQSVVEARKRDCLLHTHASENSDECAAVRKMFGKDNIAALADLDFVGPDVVLAHCVWPTSEEINLLHQSGTNVAHCPSTNLKLASGIADVVTLLNEKVKVSLGADGPPCNNRLDIFGEMRQAGLVAKFKHGSSALCAQDIFELATINGARALGIADKVGSLEVGKDADIVIIKPGLHAQPLSDPFAALVYSCLPSDVRDVFVHGQQLVENGRLKSHDIEVLIKDAQKQQKKLLTRVS